VAENGVNIAGRLSELHDAGATTADSGSTFAVTVSNRRAVTSAAATLTVNAAAARAFR